MKIALSYSRLSTAERCLRKFHHQYILKDYPDDSDNFFFKKGQRKHEQLENYVKRKLQQSIGELRYDDDIEAMFPLIDNICETFPAFAAEQKLAVDQNFEPCSWFDKSCMYRAIVDFSAMTHAIMTVIDWKTGKYRDYDEKDTGQLHLTAAIMFAHYPQLTQVMTAYAFIEHRQMLKRSFSSDDDLKTPFYKAYEWINQVTDWFPSENEYCKYCLLTRDQCEFSSKK